ncbi:MAG: restriction endonuclease subunit S [Cyclobacteriaceae bacterium]|nr:restriction endonuclease subunit S [Cyclobacteriaceae bacterium]
MLDITTKKRIGDCRDILVGKLPDPKAQIEQITIGLIYKFMDDMDKEAIELGGSAKFFSGDYEKYAWDKLFDTKVTAAEMLRLYSDAIESMEKNPNIPQLFRDIFNNAYLPYRDPETLKLFLKTIGEFEYTHSEKLGDAFEYLLSVMGSQGDAGQFRTPRHIIDFLVAIIDPDKGESILDPACGTAGFLISAYKHILLKHTKANKEGLNIYEYNKLEEKPFNNLGDALTPDDRKKLIQNFAGYDISPDMVRLSLVNLYLHGFSDPHINEYDTLSSEDRWNENADVVLANPPFMSPKGGIRPHKKFTIASNRSEVLFVDYIAEHLNPKGKAGIIVPEGVIFQSGTAYKDLRKLLVENYLYAVVSLPAGVFNPYSGVKTSILLLDKTLAKKRNEILFVKIDNDGYNLGAQRTAVKGSQLEEAIQIIHEFAANPSPLEGGKGGVAHTVPKTQLAANGDYNLSGERYRTIQDLSATEFEIVKIGDVFKTSSGGTPLKDKEEYYKNGNIPWLRSGEVSQGFITSSELFITEEGLKNSSAKIFTIDTVLVAMYGATAGQVGILKFEASTNQAVCGILPNDKAIPEYLYLVLKSQKDYMISLSGGGAQPNISQKIIRDLQIPLPSISIQEEIVAEIEGYQKIIDGAKAVVANYKPKIDIDPDWEMVELGEVCDLKGGGTPSRKVPEYWDNGTIDWITCSDFTSNSKFLPDSIRKITEEGLKNSSSNLIPAETLILVTRVSLGKLAFTSKPTALNQDLTALLFHNKEIDKHFVYYFLFSISSKIENDGNGITVKGVDRNYVKSLNIPKPPLETQRQIVAQIEKEQELVSANKQLIEIFEQKIKDRIAKVWGADIPKPVRNDGEENGNLSMAAEPKATYQKS